MAQLSNDCFAQDGALITVADALALLDRAVEPIVEPETVPLAAALNRVLTAEVRAAIDVPPADNSAVDGYAVYAADLRPDEPTRLPVVARIAAGHPLAMPMRRGTAVRIFTGAAMPKGAADAGPDTVMMQEDCTREGDTVLLRAGIKPGSNRRRAGEDLRCGQVALAGGRRLRPQDIGLAAALGLTQLSVRRRLKLALFSTGDELVEPGRPLASGRIYDSNRFTIQALLAAFGAEVSDLGILPDRAEAIRAALAGAVAGHDAIVTSGGVSTGEEDHVKAVVQELGSLYLWRLAIKPGRPVALGQIGAVPFIGLPGNPVAVMVTFLILARPLLLKLAGAAVEPGLRFRVAAGFEYAKKANRREYLRARLEPGEAGLVARRFPRDGAGILSSMVESDGLVELPEALTTLTSGSMVDFLPYSAVLS
ncbi:MAG: molybdopterin molybdotransferase MoeA [Proteobacteria bacterium]|nr:molybdopterin molybdotransferase MoeA [Pseudomonadota bacterium]MBI3496303.1 molybdopterin molybdotransferase MoeA [Pseudomonadota bacterium]